MIPESLMVIAEAVLTVNITKSWISFLLSVFKPLFFCKFLFILFLGLKVYFCKINVQENFVLNQKVISMDYNKIVPSFYLRSKENNNHTKPFYLTVITKRCSAFL